MKDRIIQLMESQHMNQQSFSNFIGINPATLNSILKERTRPTLNIV
ncbi:MAG: transcriptional regulator, partial [Prevotella sp.]|nr:transcriptional regulator [Prevotella sp.]